MSQNMRAPEIVLEGLDGSGKTTRGRKLAQALGIDFVEFPTQRVSRALPASKFNFWCSVDRREYAAEATSAFIAGRWSCSGIAYAGFSIADDAARDKEYNEAVARETDIPVAMLTVYVGTPLESAQQRLAQRESSRSSSSSASSSAAVSSIDKAIENMLAQRRVEAAYQKLFREQPTAHARDVFFVPGEDPDEDVAAIVQEYNTRREHTTERK